MAIFASPVIWDPVFLIITASMESATWVCTVKIQFLLVDYVVATMIAQEISGVNRQYLVLYVIIAMDTIAPAAVNAILLSLNAGIRTIVGPSYHLVRLVTKAVTVSQVRACLGPFKVDIRVCSQRMASCQASNFIYLF
jgi:hypothetical protein